MPLPLPWLTPLLKTQKKIQMHENGKKRHKGEIYGGLLWGNGEGG